MPQSEFCHVLAQLELAEHLPILSKRLQQIQLSTSADRSLQVLRETVLTGWPMDKSQIPPEIEPYKKFHDELTMQDGVLFKAPGSSCQRQSGRRCSRKYMRVI